MFANIRNKLYFCRENNRKRMKTFASYHRHHHHPNEQYR